VPVLVIIYKPYNAFICCGRAENLAMSFFCSDELNQNGFETRRFDVFANALLSMRIRVRAHQLVRDSDKNIFF